MMARRPTHRFLVFVTVTALLGCDSGRDAEVPPEPPASPTTTFVHSTMRLEVRPRLEVAVLDPIVARVNGQELHRSTLEAHLGRVSNHARREDVLRRLVDELLIDAWLDANEPLRPEHLAQRDAQVVAKFGDEASFSRHCGDANIAEDAVRADLLRTVRLRSALAPQPSDDAVTTLYTTVTRRPATETMVDLYSVRPSAAEPQSLCAHATSLHAFRSIRGKHTHLGAVASRALAPALARSVARGERCVAVTTAAGTQLYWVNDVQRLPTEPYTRVARQLRERETTRMLALQRAKLLQKLRDEATIELLDVAYDQR